MVTLLTCVAANHVGNAHAKLYDRGFKSWRARCVDLDGTFAAKRPLLPSCCSRTVQRKQLTTTYAGLGKLGKSLLDVGYTEERIRMWSKQLLKLTEHENRDFKDRFYQKRLRTQDCYDASMSAVLNNKVPRLYARRWTDTPVAESTDNILLRVAQFNVLADGLSGKDSKNGGFTESPPRSLDFEYRMVPLIAEVFRHGALPDIIGMQEVDHFHDWFEPVMRGLGYEGHFIPKPFSPCKSSLDPSLSDGCAVFWRREAVSILELETLTYDRFSPEGTPTGNKSNQVAILATLQPVGGAPIVVAVTHLLAMKTKNGEVARKGQITQLLDRVHAKGLPCVLTLDMNSSPHQNPTSNYPSQSYPAVKEHRSGLRSAYAEVLGDEPEYTTWKRRGKHEAKQTIDYIFVSKGINVSSVLLPPQEDEIDSARLPGWRYPSDHISLMADVRVPKAKP